MSAVQHHGQSPVSYGTEDNVAPTPTNARVQDKVAHGEISLVGAAARSRVSLRERSASIPEETPAQIELETGGGGEGSNSAASTVRKAGEQVAKGIDRVTDAIEDGARTVEDTIGAIDDTINRIDAAGQRLEQTVDRIQNRSWFQRLFACCLSDPEATTQQRQVTVQRNGATATGTLAPT